MSQIQQTRQTPRCNECIGRLTLEGVNPIGRPVYRCEKCEETQVGPFV